MKQLHLFLLAFLCASVGVFAQNTVINDSVSIGAGYAKQVWYSLANGKVAEAPKNNWDIAFDISTLRTATVLSNPIGGVVAYKSKYPVSAFANKLDSSTVTASAQIYNSDTAWVNGAYNTGGDNVFKYGWGTYNPATHIIAGDTLFIVQLSDSSYRKVWIESYNFGVWNFKYAHLDGSGATDVAISRDSFPGKHFIYYSFLTNTTVDREPKQSQWDLLFGRWIGFIPDPNNNIVPYPLTGVQIDDSVKVAKATSFDLKSNNYAKLTFSSAVNAIGYDWKTVNMTTGQYVVKDSLAYFVKAKNGVIWKLVFTGFGGAANGTYYFTKTALTTGVADLAQSSASLSVYPNPGVNGNVQVLYDAGKDVNQADLQIFDLTGRIVFAQTLERAEGLHSLALPVLQINSGLYIARLLVDGRQIVQKIVLR